MNKVIGLGFFAVIITMICCTYVIQSSIERYSYDSSALEMTIERQAELTRSAIRGEQKPAASDVPLPIWFGK